MPFCPNCGEEVQTGVKFCPSCGTSLAAAPGARSHVASASTETSKGKPIYIGILTVLHLVLGFAFLFLGGLILAALGGRAASVLLGVSMIVVAVLDIVAGFGFYKGKQWIVSVGVLAGIGCLLLGLVLLLSHDALLTLVAVLAIGVGTATVVYPRLPQGKPFFAN